MKLRSKDQRDADLQIDSAVFRRNDTECL